MADIKDKLPTPPGEDKPSDKGVSHGVMSKSFGLQRNTLARVIGLEKRVDKIESGTTGIDINKFTEINQGIFAINANLQAIGDALTEDLHLEKQEALDKEQSDKQELDSIKKGKAEKFLELKKEQKLIKPVENITKKAKSIFQRLFDGLMMIFGGFILDKGAKALDAWASGDTEKLNEMKDEIVKSLLIVGGIFAAVNIVGIISALTGLVTGLKVGIPAVLALLANPWTWLVLGIGTGMYFGIRNLDKTITGGGDFKKFDKSLRAHTEHRGIDVKNIGKRAHIIDPDTNQATWVNMYGENSITGRDAEGLENQNARTKLNLLNEKHKDYIIRNYGKEKYDQMLNDYNRYKNLMKVKEDMVGEMNKEIKDKKKAFYEEARKQEDKLRKAGKIGGADWKKISLSGWFETSAGQWWSMQDRLWKLKEMEIRNNYHKRLSEEYKELFDDDLGTIPEFKQVIEGHGPIGDTEIKNIEKDLEKYGFNNENFETKIIDGELKIIPKKIDKKDNNDENKTNVSSAFNTDLNLGLSKDTQKEINNTKIHDISTNAFSSENNFDFLPFPVGEDSDLDLDVSSGEATELFSVITKNTSNSYLDLYENIYEK